MNRPVTLADLLLILACIGGLATIVVGVRMFFDGIWTDAPSRFDDEANRGLRRIAAGAVVVIGSLVALLS